MADLPIARSVEQPNRRLFVSLLLVVAILPMAVVALIIHRFGVNVPYGDEWTIFPLLEKWSSHQLSFHDFFQVHNQHRILIPRLIYIALMVATGGNLKAEMYCSLLLCVLTSICFFFLLRRTVTGSVPKHLLLWALINLFLFSPIQAENWLWGFQLQIFLSNFFLVAAMVWISSERSAPIRVTGGFIMALAATFSFGNGLLVWPAVFGVLICRREKTRVLIWWIILALLVALIYVRGFPPREQMPPSTRWIDYLLYFTAFLGAPLARIPNSRPLVLPLTIGGVMVTIYVASAIKLFRSSWIRAAAPWIALGAYAIVSAMMAASARVHTGAKHALDSRYTTVSLVLVESLIGLLALILTKRTEESGAGRIVRKTIALTALSIALILFSINVPFELLYLRLNQRYRQLGKAALQFSSVLNVDQIFRDYLLIRLDPAAVGESLRLIDRLRLANPPRRQTLVLLGAKGQPERETEEFGRFEKLEQSSDALAAEGWAVLPEDGLPASCAILAYRDREEWKAFALSDLVLRRGDLVSRFGRPGYLNGGWKLTIAKSNVPAGADEIVAWGLEADRAATYRLPGAFRIQR